MWLELTTEKHHRLDLRVRHKQPLHHDTPFLRIDMLGVPCDSSKEKQLLF